MSGTDKTGDKLVASIRKTKAGAAKPKQAAKKAAPAKTAKPRRARTGAPAAKSRRAAAPASADPYSCGGRVWPD
jgi:hypothetical protein